jgi:cellobiose-specific phosphotransferase system component IIC
MYIALFLFFGACFGLYTFSHRHLFSEGPKKIEEPVQGWDFSNRLMWVMICTFLWPIMLLTGLHSVWILSKRKTNIANHS